MRSSSSQKLSERGQEVLAARAAGYPWPEQMDHKMSRNVEKRGVQAARNCPSADRKCWQRVRLGIHGLNRWAVNCLEISGKRGVQTDKMPRARTEALSAPSKESKPVAMRGQAGDYQKRKGHPVSGTWETWLAPHVHLATILPPHASGQTSGVRSCADPPRWLLPAIDRRIDKDRTGPDLDDWPLFVSMSPKQAIRADKIN